LAIGQPGILFVGVKDNGDIEEKQTNFEKLLRDVSGELSNIYPGRAHLPRPMAAAISRPGT
jgi:hypothetical protein